MLSIEEIHHGLNAYVLECRETKQDYLYMIDDKGESIVDIEWENFDLGRQWKKAKVPEGHDIIGVQVNTTSKEDVITKLAFVLSKGP